MRYRWPWFWVVVMLLPHAGLADTFDQRRDKLLDVLLTAQVRDHSADAYRGSWQYYQASLFRGIHIQEANEYFASSEEVISGEWQNLLYVRTYHQFKNSHLNEPARDRLLATLKGFSRLRPDTGENHPIVTSSIYLLTDQALGQCRRAHAQARDLAIRWMIQHVKKGFSETNSPHYLERSFVPLLNLYDFSDDPQIKALARISLDQLLAEYALLSLQGVRGGPWQRAVRLDEITDGRHDGLYVAAYQFFDTHPTPPYFLDDQIITYGYVATTTYRPPQVIVDLAERASLRGDYEVRYFRNHAGFDPYRSNRDTPEVEYYLWMTPQFSLSSAQNRARHDHDWSPALRDTDIRQVWELTFAQPDLILGAHKDLTTMSESNYLPHVANLQYRNVLFYAGDWLDYNGTLGTPEVIQDGERTFTFFRIPTDMGEVFVAITDYPHVDAGILEARAGDDFVSWNTFKDLVQALPSACGDNGNTTSYTNTLGEQIRYEGGNAVVDGAPFATTGYPTYGSPYMQSEWDVGRIEVSFLGGELILDVRDPNNPIRRVIERGKSAIALPARTAGCVNPKNHRRIGVCTESFEGLPCEIVAVGGERLHPRVCAFATRVLQRERDL